MDMKLLEAELLKLSPKERAVITYKLLASLEEEESENIDEIWINEALNRHKQITEDKSQRIDIDLVLKEAKSKYK